MSVVEDSVGWQYSNLSFHCTKEVDLAAQHAPREALCRRGVLLTAAQNDSATRHHRQFM